VAERGRGHAYDPDHHDPDHYRAALVLNTTED